jgi:signal transduction histidine kinase
MMRAFRFSVAGVAFEPVLVGEPGSSARLAGQALVALLAAAAFFLLAAVGYPLRHAIVFVFALAGVYLFVVVAVARRRGPLYGVPLAIAAGLAFDSFYIPPVREFGAADWQNWLVVAVYLLLGVLIGVLAARWQREGVAAETERGLLADEQAALRRVATLVASAPAPAALFATVATEVGRLLGVRDVTMFRYEEDGTATVVAAGSTGERSIRVGTRLALDGENVTTQVYRWGRAARMDDYAQAGGAVGDSMKRIGVRSAVASPIVVDGRLWGAMATGSRQAPLPPDTESRIGEFTALVAMAISNVQTRSELAASRARVVLAADDERRRVVRDLHDGAQQRLVHAIITLKLIGRELDRGGDGAPVLVGEALMHAERATVELRELVHGILPAALTRGGLRAGVDALASRTPMPVSVGVSVDRLPPDVEATAYFVVAEALTNVVKHSQAGHAEVTARVEEHTLRLEVRDDGIGGAQPDGSGLVGLEDRLAVLDGRLRVESPAAGGTLVTAAIPLSNGGRATTAS